MDKVKKRGFARSKRMWMLIFALSTLLLGSLSWNVWQFQLTAGAAPPGNCRRAGSREQGQPGEAGSRAEEAKKGCGSEERRESSTTLSRDRQPDANQRADPDAQAIKSQ